MTWTSAALAERLGGDEALARELVDIFLAEHAKLLQMLRTSVEQGEAKAIRRSAHALKGSIANFIDDGPTATAGAIECAAIESRLADIPALMEQLEPEVRELVQAMRGFSGETRCAS
jgi:HPt (histidine-containing phosphotransfer) domain-containing protein